MSRYYTKTGDNNEKNQTRNKNSKKVKDHFEGPAPIPEAKKVIHERGKTYKTTKIINKKLKGHLNSTQSKCKHAVDQAARFDLLLTEEPGFIEAEEGESTWKIQQQDIAGAADIASANKFFELNLDQFGPYRLDYTRNGRHLLLGGNRGHVAAFDWVNKKLMCEMNVMEAVSDIKWLHSENLFAVAQRKWLYVYDNQGIEIHCLKQFDETLRLEFLPYHFLLAATNRRGYLQYLDISVGKVISTIATKGGRLDVMCQNPYNATMMLGHHNGTVTVWSPNQREPLLRMLCHKTAVRGMAVDRQGRYLATSGQDRRLRIFDLRTCKPLHTYQLKTGPSNLQFSQRGLLAATCQNVVEVYKDPCTQVQEKPYLCHKLKHPAHHIKFCPYEDVLGVGKADGFASLLIPGAGEPNFDAFEANPYRSKQQRREWEVKALLEKIQPDMISLDPFQIARVDHVTAEQFAKDKEERLGFKPEPPKFEPRYKMKGRSKTGSVQKRKQKVKDAALRDKIKDDLQKKRELLTSDTTTKMIAKPISDKTKAMENTKEISLSKPETKRTALDRFKTKKAV
uniref:WD repeat-containing protein 46 n=1 Tax=Phallusia mammillata TaxID=59560 RepID=A0A6F9DW76_9ASCI|nr:WD repeat-containing protein 46-like [Phallusia mammillata]